MGIDPSRLTEDGDFANQLHRDLLAEASTRATGEVASSASDRRQVRQQAPCCLLVGTLPTFSISMNDKPRPKAHVVPIWRPDADGKDAQRFAVLAEPWPLAFLGSFETKDNAERRASAFDAEAAEQDDVPSTPFYFWCAVALPRDEDNSEWQLWEVSPVEGRWRIDRRLPTGAHPDIENPPKAPAVFVERLHIGIGGKIVERRAAEGLRDDDGNAPASMPVTDGLSPQRPPKP